MNRGAGAAAQHMGDAHPALTDDLCAVSTPWLHSGPQPCHCCSSPTAGKWCQYMKNKPLSHLPCVCSLAMGFPLLSRHPRLLHCTCTGPLPQAEEHRHLCHPVLLEEQLLTLATCHPSVQGTWLGPSATGSWHTATSTSQLHRDLTVQGHPEHFPGVPCVSHSSSSHQTLPWEWAQAQLSVPQAPLYLLPRQRSPGDMHHLPHCPLAGQHSPGQDAVGGPSSLPPPQCRAAAHTSPSLCSYGESTWFSLYPPRPSLPLCLPGHTQQQ